MDKPSEPKVVPLPESQKVRKPFTPLTGNPENGDYMDWAKELKEGEIVELKRP